MTEQVVHRLLQVGRDAVGDLPCVAARIFLAGHQSHRLPIGTEVIMTRRRAEPRYRIGPAPCSTRVAGSFFSCLVREARPSLINQDEGRRRRQRYLVYPVFGIPSATGRAGRTKEILARGAPWRPSSQTTHEGRGRDAAPSPGFVEVLASYLVPSLEFSAR